MKAHELIKALEKIDPETTVYWLDYDDERYNMDVSIVGGISDTGKLLIEVGNLDDDKHWSETIRIHRLNNPNGYWGPWDYEEDC